MHDKINEQDMVDKLRESEANFRTFFETVDDMIFVGNLQGEIFYNNGAASRKLGYTQPELRGMHILDVHPESRRAEAETIFAEMFAGKRSTCPLPLARKDGSFIPVETRVWFGKWDGKDCIFGISKDLSHEQAALEKFHKLFNSNPALLAVTSLPDRKFVEVNDTFLEKLGYTREEVIGKTSLELQLFPEELLLQKTAKSLIDHRTLKDAEFKVRKKNGQYLYGLFSGEVIDTQTEKSLLTVMADITKLKETQDELIKTRELAEAANIAKSHFLSDMSHEIRTPMNAVVAYLELLMATKVTATQQRYLDNIKVSAQILISTLNDILDLNKLDFGTVELEVIPFKLDIIVENILSQFRNKCAKKGVELKLEIEDNVPQKLRGDPLRIQQILTNLVDNAIKFTNKGQVGLKIDVLNNGENHILLAFSVSDTGIGMTPEQVEIIFDPFAQADATISRKYGGTGLGLAICKKLVELYSGDLWVESESGIGSIFHFTAMFDNFEKPLTEKSPKVKAVLKKPNKTSVNKLKDAHILLVEDNEINQRIMIELLQGAGMAVTVANDGYEAIRAINEVQYDMVLMDIRMPIMDGYEATRQIRQNPKNQSLPIIALTASTRFNDCSNYLDCGFNDYVFKPVGSAQLFSIMARWIKKKQKPMAHGTRPIVLPDEMLTIGQAEDTDEIMNLLEGIDWHRAVTNLAGKMDLFIDLLSTFNHKHQTIIREIRDAIAKGDMTLAERLAHTLKGTAGYLAADEVYQAADEIENVIRLNKYDNLGSLVNKLEKLVKRTCSSIATFEKFSELLVKGESNA